MIIAHRLIEFHDCLRECVSKVIVFGYGVVSCHLFNTVGLITGSMLKLDPLVPGGFRCV